MNKSVIKLLNKKFIISVITSSTFITGCTMAVIWFYLSNIDRLDIFFDTVSLSSAIGIIFVFIIVSLSGFSLVIFISSFILILIYTLHEDNFKNYKGFISGILPVKDKINRKMLYAFPRGEFAVACFQDTDNNSKIDKNFLGIPTNTGFSNNKKKLFGIAPDYERAKIILEESKIIQIKIN